MPDPADCVQVPYNEYGGSPNPTPKSEEKCSGYSLSADDASAKRGKGFTCDKCADDNLYKCSCSGFVSGGECFTCAGLGYNISKEAYEQKRAKGYVCDKCPGGDFYSGCTCPSGTHEENNKCEPDCTDPCPESEGLYEDEPTGNTCYNRVDRKCGSGAQCYQPYSLECTEANMERLNTGGSCSCVCKTGYHLGSKGCVENTCTTGEPETSCTASGSTFIPNNDGATFINTAGNTVRCGICEEAEVCPMNTYDRLDSCPTGKRCSMDFVYHFDFTNTEKFVFNEGTGNFLSLISGNEYNSGNVCDSNHTLMEIGKSTLERRCVGCAKETCPNYATYVMDDGKIKSLVDDTSLPYNPNYQALDDACPLEQTLQAVTRTVDEVNWKGFVTSTTEQTATSNKGHTCYKCVDEKGCDGEGAYSNKAECENDRSGDLLHGACVPYENCYIWHHCGLKGYPMQNVCKEQTGMNCRHDLNTNGCWKTCKEWGEYNDKAECESKNNVADGRCVSTGGGCYEYEAFYTYVYALNNGIYEVGVDNYVDSTIEGSYRVYKLEPGTYEITWRALPQGIPPYITYAQFNGMFPGQGNTCCTVNASRFPGCQQGGGNPQMLSCSYSLKAGEKYYPSIQEYSEGGYN